jgi:fructose-bisphosphate aldolase, class I
VSQTLVAEGEGILAADETTPTLTRRFDTLGIHSTEESRRTYREMLFTSPSAAEFISGVIMYDETIRQKGSVGPSLVEALTAQGIIPGIKVDTGAKPLTQDAINITKSGADDGKCFVRQRAVIDGCVLAGRQLFVRGSDLSLR